MNIERWERKIEGRTSYCNTHSSITGLAYAVLAVAQAISELKKQTPDQKATEELIEKLKADNNYLKAAIENYRNGRMS